jgi:hypothetical protein
MIVLALGPPLVWGAVPPLVKRYNDWRAARIIREYLKTIVPKTEAS